MIKKKVSARKLTHKTIETQNTKREMDRSKMACSIIKRTNGMNDSICMFYITLRVRVRGLPPSKSHVPCYIYCCRSLTITKSICSFSHKKALAFCVRYSRFVILMRVFLRLLRLLHLLERWVSECIDTFDRIIIIWNCYRLIRNSINSTSVILIFRPALIESKWCEWMEPKRLKFLGHWIVNVLWLFFPPLFYPFFFIRSSFASVTSLFAIVIMHRSMQNFNETKATLSRLQYNAQYYSSNCFSISFSFQFICSICFVFSSVLFGLCTIFIPLSRSLSHTNSTAKHSHSLPFHFLFFLSLNLN